MASANYLFPLKFGHIFLVLNILSSLGLYPGHFEYNTKALGSIKILCRMLICFVLAGSQTISSVSSLSDGLKLVQFSKPLLWCFGSVGAVSVELGWMVDCYSLDLKDFAILVWVYSAYVQFRHETKICVGSCTELEDTTLQFSLPWEFAYMPSS